MKTEKSFDELVKIVNQNLQKIEQEEKIKKSLKEKIIDFGKMLFLGMQNINIKGANLYTKTQVEKYTYNDILLGKYADGLSGFQIDSIKLASDIERSINDIKGNFTDEETTYMKIEYNNMYDMYKKHFENSIIKK